MSFQQKRTSLGNRNARGKLITFFLLVVCHMCHAERYSCGPFAFTNDSAITYPQFNAASGQLCSVTFEITNGVYSEEFIWDNDSSQSTRLDITVKCYYDLFSVPEPMMTTNIIGSIITNFPPVAWTNIVTNLPPIATLPIITNWPPIYVDPDLPIPIPLSSEASLVPHVASDATSFLSFHNYGHLFSVVTYQDRRFDDLDDGDGAGRFNGGFDEIVTTVVRSNMNNWATTSKLSDLGNHTGQSTRKIQISNLASMYMYESVPSDEDFNGNVEIFRTNGFYSGQMWIHYDYEKPSVQPMLSINRSNGRINFSVKNTGVSSSNIIQCTHDLITGEWQDIASFPAGSSLTNWDVLIDSNAPATYYRMISR